MNVSEFVSKWRKVELTERSHNAPTAHQPSREIQNLCQTMKSLRVCSRWINSAVLLANFQTFRDRKTI